MMLDDFDVLHALTGNHAPIMVDSAEVSCEDVVDEGLAYDTGGNTTFTSAD